MAVGGPALTRLEFARAALRVWGLPQWPGLKRVSPSHEGRLPGQTLRRPRDSSLATARLERLTGRLPTVEEGLSAVRRRVDPAP